MSTTTLPNATVLSTYEAMTPGSAKLAEKARAVLPSGLAHDSRNFDPYPIYVDPRRRAAEMGRRWQRIRRLFRRPWRVDPGPQSPEGDGGDARRARSRHAFRRLPRTGSALGRAGMPAGAFGRARALHLLRHRGDADGVAARARLHRPHEAGALHGPFPRLARPHDNGHHSHFDGTPTSACSSGIANNVLLPTRTTSRACTQALRAAPRHRGGDPRADGRAFRHDAAVARLSCRRCAS